MQRLVIMTVGKTHSGKTTFAKQLEQQLHNSIVIDQDNHAEFIHTHYKNLLPKQGPNVIKHAITQSIVDYAIENSDAHIILCNANRDLTNRLHVLKQFGEKGFKSIIVYFDLPYSTLYTRVLNSQRSKTIFRSASNFEEVLQRQHNESDRGDCIAPTSAEADLLYVIKNSDDVEAIIQSIISESSQA